MSLNLGSLNWSFDCKSEKFDSYKSLQAQIRHWRELWYNWCYTNSQVNIEITFTYITKLKVSSRVLLKWSGGQLLRLNFCTFHKSSTTPSNKKTLRILLPPNNLKQAPVFVLRSNRTHSLTLVENVNIVLLYVLVEHSWYWKISFC